MGKGRSGPDMMQLFEEAAHQGDQLGISNPVPIVKPIIRSPEKDAPDLFDDSNPKEDIPLDPDPGLLDSPGIPDTVDAPGHQKEEMRALQVPQLPILSVPPLP